LVPEPVWTVWRGDKSPVRAGNNPRFIGRPARRLVAMSAHTPIVLKF